MTRELPAALAMPARLGPAERSERLDAAAKKLRYFVPFLDEQLRGIFPNDLVLLGAPSGLGKTDIALSIASANAAMKRHVTYLALEAEPRELERRIKFRSMAKLAWDDRHEQVKQGVPARDLSHIDYSGWLAGECGDALDQYEDKADRLMLEKLSRLSTLYRGRSFNAEDMASVIIRESKNTDLIVVDHLHYVDAAEGGDDNSAISETVKALRTVALEVGKPVIAVAHLRKKDTRSKQVVPSIDDFHGSSNLTKIATQVITLDRAEGIEPSAPHFSPTFMHIAKDRRNGANRLVALVNYDKRINAYSPVYTLGKVVDGVWQEIDIHSRPHWARNHKFTTTNGGQT